MRKVAASVAAFVVVVAVVAVVVVVLRHGTAASKSFIPPYKNGIGRVCVGPVDATRGFHAGMNAKVLAFALGCVSSSAEITEAPRFVDDDAHHVHLEGPFTLTNREDPPVPDCGGGRVEHSLGTLENGHYVIDAHPLSLSFDVPSGPINDDDKTPPADGSPMTPGFFCASMSNWHPAPPPAKPHVTTNPSGTTTTADPQPKNPLDPPGMPLLPDGTPQCTWDNGFLCPAHLNCCIGGPIGPGRHAACTTTAGPNEDTPGGNICR